MSVRQQFTVCMCPITDLCLPRAGRSSYSRSLASLSPMFTAAAVAGLLNKLVPGLVSASDFDFVLPFLVTLALCPRLHLSLSPFLQHTPRPLMSVLVLSCPFASRSFPSGCACSSSSPISLPVLVANGNRLHVRNSAGPQCLHLPVLSCRLSY